jgi:hypothetical protein
MNRGLVFMLASFSIAGAHQSYIHMFLFDLDARGNNLMKTRPLAQACNRPIALTSQILRVSFRCSLLTLTISVRVQQPHTAQKLTVLIQNYHKVLKNLLCLQKLYYAQIANLSSRCVVTGAVTSYAMGLQWAPYISGVGTWLLKVKPVSC